MHRTKSLLLALLAALFLAGCSTQPKLAPNDPDVWRPAHPTYPMPQ